MNRFRSALVWVGVILGGVSLSAQATAQWELENDASSLSFVSIKKDVVGEVHEFTKLHGVVNDKGDFSIAIDLTSVKTNIDIRDQRMKEHLFEVEKLPKATITGSLDKNLISALTIGKPITSVVEIKVFLHGESAIKSANLNIVKLSKSQIYVNSVDPIILNASEFKLDAGIDTLAKLAGLPNIAKAIPVNVNFIFVKK